MNLQLAHKPHPFAVAAHVSTLEGVRVLFIQAPVREAAVPNNAPLGIALLAARLEALGADARIVDLNAYRPVLDRSEARGLLRRSTERWWGVQPELVCMSGLITTLRWQTDIARMVRELCPNAMIVSGGGLATQFREGLFEWIPELDAVAHSEGDDVIVKIAHDAKLIAEHGIESAEAHGWLAPYYRGHGRFVYEGDRPPDLDRLPLPAWHLLHEDVRGHRVLEQYIKAPVWGTDAKNSSATPFTMERSLNTVSSRGCPFACIHCFRGAQGERNYGVRSAQSLAHEFEWLQSVYQIDFVGVTDDNFMVNPRRIAELPSVLPGVRYGSHGRLDEAADPVRVGHMAESGCVYIGFGAESASPRVLDIMRKAGTMLKNGTRNVNGYDLPATMLDGVRVTHEAGIHGNATWIMGNVGETLHDLKHSVAFVKWQEGLIGEVNKSFFVLTAYPGTEVFDMPQVQKVLSERFELNFKDGKAVPDESMRQYVLSLNDATSLLTRDGLPLNFSQMSDETFLRAYEYVREGKIEEILEMQDAR